jgi:hypothetical protein
MLAWSRNDSIPTQPFLNEALIDEAVAAFARFCNWTPAPWPRSTLNPQQSREV